MKIADDQRYPGFDELYTGGGPGTQIVHLEHLTIAAFYVGVMLNCSRMNAQGDTFVIEQCIFTHDTYCVAIGQKQSRAVHLRDNQYTCARTLLTTLRFGLGTGTPPHVDGGQATSIKYLFELQTDGGPFNCNGLYAEEIQSFGWVTPNPHIGAHPVAFRGCHLDFSPAGANGRRIDCLGWLRAPTRFESCSLHARSFDFFVSRLPPSGECATLKPWRGTGSERVDRSRHALVSESMSRERSSRGLPWPRPLRAISAPCRGPQASSRSG